VRPLKFKTASDLQAAIDCYFADIEEQEIKPTISGIALSLDIDTETLRNYGKRDKFFGIVKRARQRVEIILEQRLYDPACTGSIFNLKCNFGWREKGEESNTEEATPIKFTFEVAEPVRDVKVTNAAK